MAWSGFFQKTLLELHYTNREAIYRDKASIMSSHNSIFNHGLRLIYRALIMKIIIEKATINVGL